MAAQRLLVGDGKTQERTDYLPRISLSSWIQAAIPKTPSTCCIMGTMTLDDGPRELALAVLVRLGDTPGSELGGEPKPAGLTFTKEPQCNVPASVGGVTTGTG